MPVKAGIVTFPGSNCDDDLLRSLSGLGYEVEKIWHKDSNLPKVDLVCLPGGFSYGDYLRSGAIARFSPVMKEVVRHAGRGGLVLGICNGFQILTECHLLEGALLRNENMQFICASVYIRCENSDTPFTRSLSLGQVLKIPIAHGDGRYYAPMDTLKALEDKGQIVFRYCTADGNITPESNPNGSLLNIAGICNRSKNVLGMMPHPERAWVDYLGNEDGRWILESPLKQALNLLNG